MKRRKFIGLLGGAAAWPLAARAQSARKRHLLAWLGGGSPDNRVANLNRDALLLGLREYGHEDGKDIDIVYRWAGGDMSRLPELAKEVTMLNPVVIVSAANSATIALRGATSTIPIVGLNLIEPVALGLAESHNRPGRNVTGLLQTIDSLPGKQVELLADLLPPASTIGVLTNPENAAHPIVLRDIEAAVRGSPIKIMPVAVRRPADLENAFQRQGVDRPAGLLVPVDPLFFTYADRIISLAATERLPVIHNFRQHVEQGGLMSYGVNISQSFRRAAYFVDRILNGSRAGDIPIEFPPKLELAINLKTAKALGLDIPATLLARADEVIE